MMLNKNMLIFMILRVYKTNKLMSYNVIIFYLCTYCIGFFSSKSKVSLYSSIYNYTILTEI